MQGPRLNAFHIVVLLAVVCACCSLAQEKPVLSDDFERDVRGPDWTAQNGSWTILDRALYCVGPGTITCNRPLPRNVRVEYDCFSREPCDMTLLLCLTGNSHVSGYFLGFGSEGNAKNKVLRRKREIAVDTEHLPEAKRWHHVVVEKRGRFLSMWVDGQKSLSAYDFNEMDWQQTREVQVTLSRDSSGVFDMGCGKPMSIPSRSHDDFTKFWLRLAPAEGTVLKVATQ